MGRADRALCTHRSGGVGGVLRLPEAAAVNLLPRPRSSAFDGTRVPARAPGRAPRRLAAARGLPADDRRPRVSMSTPPTRRARSTRGRRSRSWRACTRGCCPWARCDDWPDLPVRGVMLDISRDKVPTLATLRALIDRLASWKVNQVQLYMEHTFAYRDHEEVWASASPLTAEEVRDLDRFCRALPRRAGAEPELPRPHGALAEARPLPAARRSRPTGGRITGGGYGRRPRSTRPTRRRSPWCASCSPSCWTPSPARACTSASTSRGSCRPSARRLPRLGRRAARAARAGGPRDAPVGRHPRQPPGARRPGCRTGSRSASGATRTGTRSRRGRAALRRRRAAVLGLPRHVELAVDPRPGDERRRQLRVGRRPPRRRTAARGCSSPTGATWATSSTCRSASPALAYAAAVSWCLETNRDLDLGAALDVHVFDDPAGEIGGAVMALGDLHRAVTPQFLNLSALVTHLYFPQLQLDRGFTAGHHRRPSWPASRSGSRMSAATLDRARPRRPDGALVLDELRNAAALVALLCRDGRARLEADGWLASVPGPRRERLAAELAPLIDSPPEPVAGPQPPRRAGRQLRLARAPAPCYRDRRDRPAVGRVVSGVRALLGRLLESLSSPATARLR